MWSWDHSRLLVGSCIADMEIVARGGIIYTTVGQYQSDTQECTGDFFAPGTGELLDADAPICISADTQEWCAGHDPANATWESLI